MRSSGSASPCICERTPETRTIMNSSRLLLKMLRNFSRSRRGFVSSSASSRTRALNSSQLSSRLTKCSGPIALSCSVTVAIIEIREACSEMPGRGARDPARPDCILLEEGGGKQKEQEGGKGRSGKLPDVRPSHPSRTSVGQREKDLYQGASSWQSMVSPRRDRRTPD